MSKINNLSNDVLVVLEKNLTYAYMTAELIKNLGITYSNVFDNLLEMYIINIAAIWLNNGAKCESMSTKEVEQLISNYTKEAGVKFLNDQWVREGITNWGIANNPYDLFDLNTNIDGNTPLLIVQAANNIMQEYKKENKKKVLPKVILILGTNGFSFEDSIAKADELYDKYGDNAISQAKFELPK